MTWTTTALLASALGLANCAAPAQTVALDPPQIAVESEPDEAQRHAEAIAFVRRLVTPAPSRTVCCVTTPREGQFDGPSPRTLSQPI